MDGDIGIEMAKILLVEDDNDMCQQIESWLKHEQHAVEIVKEGPEAADRLKFYKYDVVILDWQLPGMSGVDVLKQFRNQGGSTPVLMLTGKGNIEEKEQGLDSGADDYLTKPFHFKELSARLRAMLRRPAVTTGNQLKLRGIELDLAARKVSREGEDVHLLPKEFALLEFLLRHPNEVFSPEALLDRVWHSESDSSVDTVYTTMRTLRKKISTEKSGALIKTVHGLGYTIENR
ncbi:MAG: response regulator transcription factor [Candidatus Melainabacteria bacterium]|nr:response regulator transcription factor [Candidatus Melainabacteria bacterium]